MVSVALIFYGGFHKNVALALWFSRCPISKPRRVFFSSGVYHKSHKITQYRKPGATHMHCTHSVLIMHLAIIILVQRFAGWLREYSLS